MSSTTEPHKFAYSEPGYAKGGKDKSSPWYLKNIDSQLVPETRKLLLEYSKVPEEQLSQHIHTIRDKAWAIRSYPCTGLGVWLAPNISRSPRYPDILQRMQNGGTYLDIGCFIGQDMRRIFIDGVPSNQLYGVDIVSHWDVGFDFFRDRDRFSAHFIQADILAPDPGSALHELEHARIDVIAIYHVLHQWGWDDQIAAARRLVAFTRGSGSMVVGAQIGNVRAKEDRASHVSVPQWRHDPESMKRFWDQVGVETGTRWSTQAWLRTWEDMGWDPENHKWQDESSRLIEFVATRVE